MNCSNSSQPSLTAGNTNQDVKQHAQKPVEFGFLQALTNDIPKELRMEPCLFCNKYGYPSGLVMGVTAVLPGLH